MEHILTSPITLTKSSDDVTSSAPTFACSMNIFEFLLSYCQDSAQIPAIRIGAIQAVTAAVSSSVPDLVCSWDRLKSFIQVLMHESSQLINTASDKCKTQLAPDSCVVPSMLKLIETISHSFQTTSCMMDRVRSKYFAICQVFSANTAIKITLRFSSYHPIVNDCFAICIYISFFLFLLFSSSL